MNDILSPTGIATDRSYIRGRTEASPSLVRIARAIRKLRRLLTAVVALILVSGYGEAAAQDADGSDAETVRAFYTDVLTAPAETTEERYYELFSPAVVSIPTPPGGPGAQGMLNTIAFLGQVVPDLTWEPQEIIGLDDGRFVVRGLATGTPVGPFFGVDPPTGRSFEIMSIDILTLEEGRVVHVYHLEDWTSAIAQLTAEE